MINAREILNKIPIHLNSGLKQVLFESPDIRITHWSSHLEMECFEERKVNKIDLSAIAIFFRKYRKLTGNNKLLLFLSNIWRLDMDAWTFITKAGFFGSYIIAFVSTELHQTLLLRELGRSNHNVKIFKSKERAEEWLGMQP